MSHDDAPPDAVHPVRRVPKWMLFGAAGVVAALVVTAVVVVVNLGGPGSAGGIFGPDPAKLSQAERHWGLSPSPDSTADFQDDVVIVEHGALAVQGVLDDGVTWLLDPGYPGLDRVAEGDVLFLTNQVVGRVAAIERAADGVQVVLMPVELPEILRNADIVLQETVSDEDFAVELNEDYPGMIIETPLDYDDPELVEPTEPDAEGTEPAPEPEAGEDAEPGALPGPTMSLVGLTVPNPTPTPTPTDVGWSVAVSDIERGPWKIGIGASGHDFSFKATIAQDGLVGGLSAKLSYQNLKVDGSVGIKDGKWTGEPTLVLDGLTGFEFSFYGGVANGMLDNAKYKFDVPLRFTKQLLIAEVPFYLEGRFKFSFATAFTAQNATLSSSGTYVLSGPLGILKGEAVVPDWSVASPMIDSVAGISLGIDSAIFGVDVRFHLGLGLKSISMGPFGRLTVSAGVLRGSSLTAPWGVPCQVTVVATGGGGVGGQMEIPFSEAIQKRLKLGVLPSVEWSPIEKSVEIVNRTVDRPICANLMQSGAAPTETPPVTPRQVDNDPFTAAGARKVPGTGAPNSPRPDRPVTEGVERPTSPNSDYGEDGYPSGPEPGPKPTGNGDDGYNLEYDYCDLQPDPVRPEPDLFGNPTNFTCADWERPSPSPTPTRPPGQDTI